MSERRSTDYVNFWSEFESGNLDFAFRIKDFDVDVRETY